MQWRWAFSRMWSDTTIHIYRYDWEKERNSRRQEEERRPTADARPFSEAVAAVEPAKNCTINVPINSPVTDGVSVGLFLDRLSILLVLRFPSSPPHLPLGG